MPMLYNLIPRFLRFSLVGGSALLIDFLILFLLIERNISDPFSAKLFSLIVTIFYTWYLNRKFTFKNTYKNKIFQVFVYYLFMALGMLINYCMFFVVMLLLQDLSYNYLFASAAGSATAMMVNFLNMNFIIFKKN